MCFLCKGLPFCAKGWKSRFWICRTFSSFPVCCLYQLENFEIFSCPNVLWKSPVNFVSIYTLDKHYLYKLSVHSWVIQKLLCCESCVCVCVLKWLLRCSVLWLIYHIITLYILCLHVCFNWIMYHWNFTMFSVVNSSGYNFVCVI